MARRAAWLMFVVSGAAGLVFEVTLQRSLTRVFGVSAFATSTVLAAWMAGLALGALAFGRLADRVRSPLRLYAWLEVGIAALAALAPLLLPRLPGLFASLAGGLEPADSRLLAGRFALAFVITLAPTVLMGGTLPAVARGLARVNGIAGLYTANLVGAAVGAGLTSYALLPALGLTRTQHVGGALNLAAAALAFFLARRAPAPETPAAVPLPSAPARAPWATLVTLSAWSGFVTFCAEVTWFHLLAVVVGNSAYAFGAMLATFLLGLTLGSAWLARRRDVTVTLAGWLQLSAAIALTLSLPLWEHVPYLFLVAGPRVTSFEGRELVRAAVCLYMLLVPSAVLGAIFPMVLRLSPGSASEVGRLSAINTIAAVVGALATGFWLLPALGSRGLLVLLVTGTCAATLLLLPGRLRALPVLVTLGAFALPQWDLGLLSSGVNVYFARQPYSGAEAIWHRESTESGLTAVLRREHVLTLLTNGKFQGNNTGEVQAQRAIAQVPMLVQHRWGSALVVGLGTGCSLGETASQPWREVELIELSADIIAAARECFSEVNDDVLRGERVKVIHADARNALLLSPRRYDLISMEISSIWFAGAADLYGREFNALVRAHLEPEGIFQQWVQLHHLTRRDLAVILSTLRAEFAHVALFARGGQGIVLASETPLWVDYPALVALSKTPAARNLPARDPLLLAGSLVLDPAGVDALIAQERGETPPDEFISTDDSLALEFSTPRGNAREDLDVGSMLESLEPLRPTPLEVRGADADGQKHAAAAWALSRGARAEGLRLAAEAGPAAEGLLDWARRQP